MINQEAFDRVERVLLKQGFQEKRKVDTPKGEIHIYEAYFVGADELPHPHINTLWLVHNLEPKCARPCRHQIMPGMPDQKDRLDMAEKDAKVWLSDA